MTYSKSRFIAAIFGVMLTSSAIVLPEALATTSWLTIGQASTSASATELSGFVSVPHSPGSGALGITELFLGGWSSSGHSYLNQPQIVPITSSYWRGYMEVYDQQCGCDAEMKFQTNVTPVQSDTVRFDAYLSSGQSCQTVKDASTGATATHCFSAHTYGSTYNTAWASLESTDYTSTDWTPMDGTISFTNINQYVSGVSSHPSFSMQTQNSPPSCATGGSGGSGSTSITLSC